MVLKIIRISLKILWHPWIARANCKGNTKGNRGSFWGTENMAVTASMERDVWFWKSLIIYRMLLNKKIYRQCFCHRNRFWHVPMRLSTLFISVSHGPSKTDFKELLVVRRRTGGNIWKNKWLMASLLSLVVIMQNLQCFVWKMETTGISMDFLILNLWPKIH